MINNSHLFRWCVRKISSVPRRFSPISEMCETDGDDHLNAIRRNDGRRRCEQKEGGYFAAGRKAGRGMARFRDSLSTGIRDVQDCRIGQGKGAGKTLVSFRFVSSRLVMDRCFPPCRICPWHSSPLSQERSALAVTRARGGPSRGRLSLYAVLHTYMNMRMCVRHELHVVRDLSRNGFR